MLDTPAPVLGERLRAFVVATAAVVVSASVVGAVGYPYLTPAQDFAVYLAAGRAYFSGGDPYALPGHLPFVYAYPFLWLVRPVVDLPDGLATVVASGAVGATLVATLWVILQTSGVALARPLQALLVTGLLVLGNQMALCVNLETLNVEALCVLCLSMALARPDQERLFGALVAVAAAIKPHYALFVVPSLVLQRRIVPIALVAGGLAAAYVVPFAVHPAMWHGLLENLGRRSVEHGHWNPSLAVWTVHALRLDEAGGQRFVVAFTVVASVAYLLGMREFWRRLPPEGRAIGTLLYFVLVTPRLKDYSLFLLFLPALCAMGPRARASEDPWCRRLVAGVALVGVAWLATIVACSGARPIFASPWPVFRVLSMANLAIAFATMARLLHLYAPGRQGPEDARGAAETPKRRLFSKATPSPSRAS